jgi:cytochrome c biogenesis protein CcdA
VSAVGFALAAGLVAAVNPCGFAMLPAYLSLVVTGEDGATGTRAVVRALAATVVMALGFLVVFGAFGLVLAPLATSVQRYLPAVTVLIGLVLLGLGGWLLSGRHLSLPMPGRGAPTRGIGSMFGYGVAYAIASLSCTIGPFLAVTSATFRSGSVAAGVAAYLAYGLGMTLVVGVLAVAGSSAARGMRRLLPYVNRISGVLMVLVGLYVGYYGVYELRLFWGGGQASDPGVDVATRIQGALVGWLAALGPLPLVGVLAVLVLGAVAVTRRRSA